MGPTACDGQLTVEDNGHLDVYRLVPVTDHLSQVAEEAFCSL